jgi:long-subunit fatty acid transport protein
MKKLLFNRLESSKLKNLFLVLCLQGSSIIFSQSIDDAVTYSQTTTGGTALSLGLGGAIGAVGGDFSCASVNPAGLGLFRKSEFSISPGLLLTNSNTRYYGNKFDERKFNANVSDFHLVLHFPTENPLKKTGWMSTTFGIGYVRNNSLHQETTFKGVNPSNSIVNAFAGQAYGRGPGDLDPFGADLAYQTFLIDSYKDSSGIFNYTSLAGPQYGGVTQRGTYATSGRVGETDISFAANYSNKLYLGASLAIRRIVTQSTYDYTETDVADTIDTFNSLTYQETRNEKGTATALRAGAIYRVSDWLRLGAAGFVSLDYSFKRNFSSSMSSSLITNSSESTGSHAYDSPVGDYNYKLRTPARLTTSAAFIIKKMGLVSVDYEFVNYSKTRLIDKLGLFDSENATMMNKLRSAGNLRIGAEYRADDLYFRAGFQLTGSPYTDARNDRSIKQFSIGGGYRTITNFIDVAYSFATQNRYFDPYSTSLTAVQPASIKFNSNVLLLTVGTRF